MKLLVLNKEIKNKFKTLVKYAEKYKFTMDDLLDIKNGEGVIAGEVADYTLEFDNFRVVFSIEEQVPGNVRHLSVSVNIPGKLPSIYVVEEIMKMVGFENELENCAISLEDLPDGEKAVNVLEIIDFKGNIYGKAI
jgi:hypothetical protein